MVHLLPMNWTDHEPGEPVQVWAYSNVDSVELYLNGRSLGERRFDRKTTPAGRAYLETTEATDDDKTVTGGPYPGSYTSPNGSAGKLHLTLGRAVRARQAGGGGQPRTATWSRATRSRTAGTPSALRLGLDRRAGGGPLSYVTADVVDRHGVHRARTRTTSSPGRRRRRLDRRPRQRARGGPRGLQGLRPHRVQRQGAGDRRRRRPGRSVTATAPGLRPGSTDCAPARRCAAAPHGRRRSRRRAFEAPAADAGYSGAAGHDPGRDARRRPGAPGWSNLYVADATALLPEISLAHAREWVSLAWPAARRSDTLTASFTIDAHHALPAAIAGQLLGRAPVRPGARPARGLGGRLEPGEHDHLRPGTRRRSSSWT